MIFCNSRSLGKFVIYLETKIGCGKPAVAYFTRVSLLVRAQDNPNGADYPLPPLGEDMTHQ